MTPFDGRRVLGPSQGHGRTLHDRVADNGWVCLFVSTDRVGNKEWRREIKLTFTATVPIFSEVMWRQFKSHLHSRHLRLCRDMWLARPLRLPQSPPSGSPVYDAT